MKKILILSVMALIAVISAPSAIAQVVTPNQTVTINASDLTPAQLAKIEADKKFAQANFQIEQLQKKVDTYGKWIGVGGEIGTAVKEGLTAVVDVADKFSNTDVGKFTMTLIAWKVIGQDIVRIILGLFFFAVLTIIEIKIYRRVVMPRKELIKDPGFLKYPKEYQVVESNCDGEETIWMTVILLVVFLLGIWITCRIMF